MSSWFLYENRKIKISTFASKVADKTFVTNCKMKYQKIRYVHGSVLFAIKYFYFKTSDSIDIMANWYWFRAK